MNGITIPMHSGEKIGEVRNVWIIVGGKEVFHDSVKKIDTIILFDQIFEEYQHVSMILLLA